MNQILYDRDKIKINKKYKFIYKALFFLFIIIVFISISFVYIKLIENKKNEQISKKLTDSYSITTLYSNNIEYTTNIDNDPFVIRNNKN